MTKLLLNAEGKVLTSNDKVLKAPEGEDRLKTLLDTTKNCYGLFKSYQGENVDDLISYNDTENVTDMGYMFEQSAIKKLPNLNTSKVESLDYCFEMCKNITTLPFYDTSNVTSAIYAFKECENILEIPQYNFSKLYTSTGIFYSCKKIVKIPNFDFSYWNDFTNVFTNCNKLEEIPKINNKKSMSSFMNTFQNCYVLKTIDIETLDGVTSTTYMQRMANNCYSLTKFIVRTMTKIPILHKNSFTGCYHFLGTVDATYNPDGLKDGKIYVPDDFVEQLKSATNWSAYADIIVPLSTLQEE